MGGTLLSDINDPEKKSVVLFSKGSTVIILFEVTTDGKINIPDVVEITNVQKNQEIKLGVCRDGDSDNPNIVALVEQSQQERWKALKALAF